MMENYAKKTVQALLERNLKIATAESCTGGLTAKLITDISGASAVFECGVVSYANRIKESLLGVREETLRQYGAVSEQTVREMAVGVQKLSGADVTVAISGIAGPESDGTDKPVGLIWIAVFYENTVFTKKLNNRFSVNIRENNRNAAANEALKFVYEVILQEKAV